MVDHYIVDIVLVIFQGGEPNIHPGSEAVSVADDDPEQTVQSQHMKKANKRKDLHVGHEGYDGRCHIRHCGTESVDGWEQQYYDAREEETPEAPAKRTS